MIYLAVLQMPGTIMAMGRLNRPSIMIYGGTIKVGGNLTLAYSNVVLDLT